MLEEYHIGLAQSLYAYDLSYKFSFKDLEICVRFCARWTNVKRIISVAYIEINRTLLIYE